MFDSLIGIFSPYIVLLLETRTCQSQPVPTEKRKQKLSSSIVVSLCIGFHSSGFSLFSLQTRILYMEHAEMTARSLQQNRERETTALLLTHIHYAILSTEKEIN